jgi:hypothetical protein
MLTARFGVSGLVAAGFILPVAISLASSPSDDVTSVIGERRLEGYWADLQEGEMRAARALLSLADRPGESVEFLKKKLKPLKISSGQVKALLLKLGSANEALSKPAFEELEYFDPRLAIELETLMDRYTEYPLRQRLVEVLSGRDRESMKDYEDLKIRPVDNGFNFTGKMPRGVLSWWAEDRVGRISSGHLGAEYKKKWTRAVRAIVLLEHIRTPGAIAILKDMAGGHPDAYPTKVAKEALAGVVEKPSTATDEKQTTSKPSTTVAPKAAPGQRN